MLSPVAVYEIDSSDEEKTDDTIEETIIIEDDNKDKIAPKTVPVLDQVSTPSKNITITVEDRPDKHKVNSTKIVIAIDEVQSQGEPSVHIIQARKDIMGSPDDYTLEFLHFLELCLKLERSDGMIRIIQRNLIPNYKAADKSYVESAEFQTFLEEIISKIELDPLRKFSCMKHVCDVLKDSPRSGQARKRVSLVTLDKKVSDKTKTMYNNEVANKRRKVDEVIDLDKIDDNVIDVDAPDPDDVILVFDEKSHRNNNHISNYPNPPPNTCNVTNRRIHKDVSSPDEISKQKQIKDIEDYLLTLKNKVKQFEEMEVVGDDCYSPYLMADHFKAQLIQTYKSLCKLTGEEFVRKPKQIKICAPEGIPPGPVLRLERLLNSQAVGDDIAFPDFIDVVKCVTQASVEDGLGWTNYKILQQARALFSQCGKALQHRRQRREWRDLVCKVETLDPDPAETDPALEARLQENMSLARWKEDHLLQHYALMANNPSARNHKKSIVIREPEPMLNTQSNMIEIEISGKMAYSDKMQVDATSLRTSTSKEIVTMFQETTSNDREMASIFQENVTSQLVSNTGEETYSNLQENVLTEMASEEFEDVKPVLIPHFIDPETEIVCSDSEDYSSTDDDLSDFELDTALNARTEDVRNEDNREKVIGNVVVEEESKDDTENDFSYKNKMYAVLTHSSSPAEINKKEVSQTIPRESDKENINLVNSEGLNINAEPADDINKIYAVFTHSSSPAEINKKEVSQTIPRESDKEDINIENSEGLNINAESANECVEENTDEKAEVAEEMIKIKSETNTTMYQGMSAEDTLKMLLSFDKTSLENGSAYITSTIFDIEEPVMFIEISSSESESDEDDS